MNKLMSVLLMCVTAPAALVAQYSPEQVVADNVPFFEHMLTTIATTSGIHQQSFLGHIRLSKAESEIVLKIAGEFQQREDSLREQAYTALKEKRPDMNSILERLRLERNQLLRQSAVQILRVLDVDASSRLIDHIQRVAVSLPKRTGK